VELAFFWIASWELFQNPIFAGTVTAFFCPFLQMYDETDGESFLHCLWSSTAGNAHCVTPFWLYCI